MSKKIKCTYCNNLFSSRYILNNHIKNAKYCLKLRGQIFKCVCNKEYISIENLNNHQLICMKYIENKYKEIIENLKKEMDEQKKQLENSMKDQKKKMENSMEDQKKKHYMDIIDLKVEHKDEMKELKNDLKDIAMESVKRPINITNNNNRISQTINNLIPIEEGHFKEQAQYLTLDHIKNGVEGYAKYALEYPLKNRVVCVDFSRRKLKYKNKDGEVIIDQEMTKLSQKLFAAIEARNTQLIRSYVNELKNKLYNNDNDEMTEEETEQFTEQTDLIINAITEMTAKRREVREAANGLKPDMYNDFLRNVCTLAC